MAESAGPPHPFAVVGAFHKPIVDLLDPRHIYIIHVDTLPWFFKRRIFMVPVLLNISIAALLLWRAFSIIPVYLNMVMSLLGYNTSTTVDVSSRNWFQLIGITLSRTFSFMFDFLLVRFVMWWPITFFLERPANPILWRWRIGFRDAEVVVRVSRQWGTEDLLRGQTKGDKNPFFKVRILPAIDKAYLRGKTGYLMMDRSWDLDFSTMIKLTEIAARNELRFERMGLMVLACDDDLGWLVWEPYKSSGEEGAKTRQNMEGIKARITDS
jgi:hypothetical protein